MSYVKKLLRKVDWGDNVPPGTPSSDDVLRQMDSSGDKFRLPASEISAAGERIERIQKFQASRTVSPLRASIDAMTKHRDDIMRAKSATSAEIARLTQLEYEQAAVIEGFNRAIDSMSMRVGKVEPQEIVTKAAQVTNLEESLADELESGLNEESANLSEARFAV